jgi:hypothetical protein
MNYKDLAESVKYYKEDDGGYNMCKLMEDYTERKSRIAEQKGKEETARKMIADGMPFDMVAKYSGLTVAQVEQLAEENK